MLPQKIIIDNIKTKTHGIFTMKAYNNTSLKTNLQSYVQQLALAANVPLHLHIIQIGDDFSSASYINRKQKMGAQLGINVTHHHFPLSQDVSSVENIVNEIIQKREGIIIQLPIAEVFQPIISSIPWYCDVDLLGNQAYVNWNLNILPPTISAIDLVIKDMYNLHPANGINTSKIDLQGKNVAVIGQGVLVGNPLLQYLKDREATIFSINKSTKNPQEITNLADIIITGAGVPSLIDKNWMKPDALIIDAATSESNNKLVGDVDYANLSENAFVCTSPGGVGPLTVLNLFYNLVNIAQKK